MKIFRRVSHRRLAALTVALVGVAAAAAVLVVTAFGGGSTPGPEPLDQAIENALSAPAPAGITAQVSLTDHLFDSSGLGAGLGSSLLSGATGELWLAGDGHARLDLETGLGDVQILFDGTKLTVYDAGMNTALELSLPASAAPAASSPADIPSLGEIDSFLAALAKVADVSGPTPTTIADQPAYSVSLSPAASGGLLGSLSLGFDATTGVPLSFTVDAAGSTTPVLSLTVTSISYAAVPSSEVDVTPPAGATVIPLTLPASVSSGSATPATQPVSGLAAVSQAVAFTLVAPGTLDGLARGDVELVGSGADAGALVSYGTGLDGLVVLERPASSTGGPYGSGLLDLLLPSVTIGSATGHELSTPLGTLVTFRLGGVSYAVVGSVDQSTAEAAARALAG